MRNDGLAVLAFTLYVLIVLAAIVAALLLPK